MQFTLHPSFDDNTDAQRGKDIIAACVHCGFCTATCPTYQLLGDERDSPRGRIYLIKHLLESNEVSEKTMTHLDRCLTCRSCETTCPSGVKYGELIEIGRHLTNERVPRKTSDNLLRFSLKQVLPYRKRFSALLRVGQTFKAIAPAALRAKIPDRAHNIKPTDDDSSAIKTADSTRTMILLMGCAQPSATPNTNAATKRVFNKLGIALKEIRRAGCCGAVNTHMDAKERGKADMRRNIDAWWPEISAGAEAIAVSASACGLMIKEYGHYLADDPAYADKAAKISEMARDISEILVEEDLSKLKLASKATTAFHCPCSMQHGQPNGKSLGPLVEKILTNAGLSLTATKDSHLCCGSAGTYSITQPELSQRLLKNKLVALQHGKPEQIVTANIGCQLHLASKADIPVKHWIELLDTDSAE